MLCKYQLTFKGSRILKYASLAAMIIVSISACDDGVVNSDTNSPDSIANIESMAKASNKGAPVNCANQVNNNTKKLLDCVTIDGVRRHQAAFQAIADANNGTRVSGSEGYNASVDYVSHMLMEAGYEVETQDFDFDAWYPIGTQSLEQTSPFPFSYAFNTDFNIMTQSAAGNLTASVTAVDLSLGSGNLSTSGCEASDFAGFPAGNIALIQRGGCTFQLKAINAEAAGASGVIIFNQGNIPGNEGLQNGTLGTTYSFVIPVMGATYALGVEWANTPGLVLSMEVNVFDGQVTTQNVFAELPGKNADNVVLAGAHLDAVPAGPGINDNGSGSAAILETALQMAKIKPENTVRFAWWGAEEFGLIGSNYYVANLPFDELQKIALYLNFDMIGSPNYVYFIYDGDNSDGFAPFGGVVEAAAIEDVFEEFYTERGVPFKKTSPIIGSDQLAFYSSDIPVGGLLTGAGLIKTPEEADIWGGTAGDQYDPCYHLACDTFDNVSMEALE
ncbi:MAG: M28 family peptidase, partial [Cyclonatronaceae bacterium]